MWGEIDPKDKARLETLAATAKAKWEKEKVGFLNIISLAGWLCRVRLP